MCADGEIMKSGCLFAARPTAPVLSPVVVSPRETSSEPVEMTCAAGGFYPKEAKVTWFFNGIMLKEARDETTGPAADGTFSVLSRITLSPSVSVLRDAVVCEIQHQALSQPLRTNVSMDRKPLMWECQHLQPFMINDFLN
uniref:Ig-like domain-containing protein n=1 Tax=Scleropages formosus TaxID=113540 RepID=A0A8C9UXP4_SCLFO